MKKVLLTLISVAFICLMTSDADAVKNSNAKWALHNAGGHDAKAHTCAFTVGDCNTGINIVGPVGGARNDIYILAIDVVGIAGTRYGLCCDGPFWFYGWTKCSDLEIPTTGWPACGGANAQTWAAEVSGPNVTVGILDVYSYPSTVSMSVCVDSRVGFAQVCDGSQPSPICFQTDGSDTRYFGVMGFNGTTGYNPCNVVPTEQRSWGSVKSLYR